ncbi:MAG: FKBP-type peptidyl-prolyl cis-trans isomerase [Limisphaerales bacterium]
MRAIFLTAIFSLAAAGFLFASGTNVLTDEKARVSYAIGMMVGNNLKQQNIDVDNSAFLSGLDDQESGKPTLMTPQEAQTTIRDFQQKARAALAGKNKSEGEAFLAQNKNKPGVVTLPDGLQYKILTDGTGATPSADSIVTVNYRGTFINGTEFDSSQRAGHPVQFPANHVIPGWTEALTKMKVGSKWELFIPSALAYGERGNRVIPPNATLIFDVELLKSENPPPPAAPKTLSAAPLTSDIIKVPSAAEMKKGAKIEVIKPEDLKKAQSETQSNQSK